VRGLATALAAGLLMAPAAAAQDTGSIIPSRGRPASPEGGEDSAEAQRILVVFSRCVVLRNRRGVERFLALIPGSPDWSRAGARIATSDCLYNGQLRFQPPMFRGALYEALYRIDFRARPIPDLAAAPAVDYAGADTASLNETQRGWVALQSFADCVVRAAPSAARALVLSGIGASEERRAFALVTPALGPCLVAGVELRFSRPVLRGLISESLYRLTAAAVRGSSAASGTS
jgi:hypothetical protein